MPKTAGCAARSSLHACVTSIAFYSSLYYIDIYLHISQHLNICISIRLEPIMLLKLPIICF